MSFTAQDRGQCPQTGQSSEHAEEHICQLQHGAMPIPAKPFGELELDQYLLTWQIIGPASDYIRRSAAGLSRDVRPSKHSSCVVEFQSLKNGVTVSTESRTGELPYAFELDYDNSVLAYYEQPPAVEVSRHTKRGYRRLTRYTPDFLVLTKDGPRVVQVKLRSELERIFADKQDWVRQEDGSFQDVVAAEAFETMGLPHVVVAIDEVDQLRAANLGLMRRAMREVAIDEAVLERSVSAHMEQRGLSPLADLAHAIGQHDLTPLIRLVARHLLYTDIGRYSLTHPETCLVAREPALLNENYVEAWQHLKLEFQGRCDGTAQQYDFPLEKHLEKGLAAVEKLKAGENGRSARRWRLKIREAEAEGVNAVVALSREYMKRGNRNPKRPEQVQLATEYIRSQWAGQEKPSPPALYRGFKLAAEEALPMAKPLSKVSFYNLLDRAGPSLAYQRGGNRACHAAEPPTDVAMRALRPERPFELATCDHYLCDQYCVVLTANGMEYAMRPWLTILRDIYSDFPLAFWLRLGAPSKRSVALILRQCVRLHGRLPEGIVVDSGSDFRSVYFSALAAHCGFNLIFRPVGHPRYGAEAERFFGQYKTLWLAARPGNLVNLKEVRCVSGSHRPEAVATMSLFDLWQDFSTFADWSKGYATDSALGSPAERMTSGLERFGCSGLPTTFDDNFLIATAVDAGEYTLDPQRGLHIGAFHYWSPTLVRADRPKIPVRPDPQDPYRIYAQVAGTWVACFASPEPSYALKSGLQQVVEGVLQLDRYELNKAIREDSDRLLARAIQRRSTGPSTPLVEAAGFVPQRISHNAEASSFFADVLDDSLPELAEATW
ncbi:TnsA endonuclease N-terminal domain-containing protein [Dyella acidiphila]|uniref:DDE-type integrase/transposase/recombinase n=1 Tax=Dyella acidiphila TaxID=2775866 RepID=A0ABR9GE20_9GAMM|nr:TnsA endonuclease N-terminal domain-containing protein [Dyella acidiphila]MBE1162301.1 DDE-type integrase/transposase/recombinase [Dyella acidiphila]